MPEQSGAAESPRVTVIIPTYNWSSVLPYSIGSVLRQSFIDFELLVIGDGCTDDSEQVVVAIADPRLRWINLAVNAGHQSGPNNEGLRQARGSIVAYLGHDDLWLPHHLETLVASIDAGADVAHSIVHMIDADGNILRPAPGQLRFEPGRSLPPTGVAHRRIASEKVGGWRDYRDLAVDPETDLWQRMHLAGFKFQAVLRLTAVKFPASGRKDVYKKRSSHEQQQWTDRIRNEPNLEALELGKLLFAMDAPASPAAISVLFQSLLGEANSGSVRWRLLFKIRSVLSLGRLQPPENGAVIRRIRQFKGVQGTN
jgi:glycosyltransferase involved in cell wall biosynthesis